MRVVLDVLPAACAMETDWNDEGQVRFRAVRGDERTSAWSGWFAVDEEPIRLSWAAFDFGDDTPI